MDKYHITLTVKMHGEVTIYADSLTTAEEMAFQRVRKGLIDLDVSEAEITEITQLPCTKIEIEKQKIIEQIMEQITSGEIDREYYLEAMKLGIITRLPKEMR